MIHSGLEMLKEEMLSMEIALSRTASELMDDIIEASGIANDILDDLLNYENIDAGINLRISQMANQLLRFD